MSGAEMIAVERMRQVGLEGWTQDHDDGPDHDAGELICAAIAYAMVAFDPMCDRHASAKRAELEWWPWDVAYWKPSDQTARNLVKAGALIAAELDRIQRQAAP